MLIWMRSLARPTRIPNERVASLRVEQVDMLAKLGGAIGCVGVLAALAIVSSFWHNASRVYLCAFLSLFIVVYVQGFRRSILWRKRPKPATMDRRSYVVRCMHVGIIGVLWSTMPVMLMPVADDTQRLLVVYVSSGLIASAVVISPTLLAACLIAIPVILGTMISLVTLGTDSAPLLGSLVLIYSSLILVTALHNHRAFIQRALSNMELRDQQEVIGLLLRDFEQQSSDWLWRTDAEGRLCDSSERMEQAGRVQSGALEGEPLLDWLGLGCPAVEQRSLEALTQRITDRAAFRDVIVPVQTGGEPLWWNMTGKPVFDRGGQFQGYQGVASDVTASREAQARVVHLANHDSLTNLPNRAVFRQQLSAAIDTTTSLALLWLDLDRFKAVNDTLGHAVGDSLLIEVSDRLRACVGHDDVVARLGGDEFAILHRPATPDAVTDLARCVSLAINRPFDLADGVRAGVGVTIGIALSPHDGADADELFKNADLALYRAKGDGRGRWRFYDAEMDAAAKKRQMMQSGLRSAPERNEFRLVFQPIVDAANGRVRTLEALLRWQHLDWGTVSPAAFIPIAEETGMIIPIGEWVLRTSCQAAARWPDDTQLAVNLSPVQFRDSGLVDAVRGALSYSGLEPQRLELELTEGIFLEATADTMQTLHQLRDLGVSIALDDFGTGYSSLSYLRSFPFDKVKIDQSFVQSLPQDASALAIVRAIVGMATSLGMRVVAEGVENAGQAALLRTYGCTRLQGFHFSRPLAEEAVADFIEQRWSIRDNAEPVRALEVG